ncbi:MAG: potassium/proton antiporter [Flavobacteriales bacterium]|nr:potassium/proton antiporter [Flavobacteriales bacterium]
MQIEIALLILSVLFFLSILAGKASSRFGVPALLLFLAVGMLWGSDGLGIRFEDVHIAQSIGTVALCIILFSGGMDTRFSEVRPIIAQGVVLATVGVLLTAIMTGALIWLILGMTMQSAGIGVLTSLLLASTMSSTDSASVFSILRSKGLRLKNNLRPMLELESGSNDPMAYVLVITMIGLIQMDAAPNYWLAGGLLLLQLSIGLVAGYLLGKLAVITINRINIGNDSLYPILVFTFCIFIFSITHFIKGNGFLAVYVGGLVIGNSKFVRKRSSLNFFDGLAWISQLVMFLTLGLLVNPKELLPLAIPGLLISLSMIFIARPLTVFLCLLPFRKMPIRDKAYVSWVGLRGAVPIIFAIFPLVADVPHARLMFNIVFFCTLVSLILQGTSLAVVAQWLHLDERQGRSKDSGETEVDLLTDIKSIATEIEVTASILEKGNKLVYLPLPDDALAVLVKRGGKYFAPTGTTILKEKDIILLIADNHADLMATYQQLGVYNLK